MTGRLFGVVGLVTGLALGWWVLPSLFFERVQAPVSFSHAAHSEDAIGLTCLDCHATDDVHYVGLPRIDACAQCHAETLGESEDEARLVSDYVSPGVDVAWAVGVRQPEGVRFSHAQHVVLAELECATCHGDVQSRPAVNVVWRNRITGYGRELWGRDGIGPASGPSMEMSDCADCHRHRGVVQSCLDCHR